MNSLTDQFNNITLKKVIDYYTMDDNGLINSHNVNDLRVNFSNIIRIYVIREFYIVESTIFCTNLISIDGPGNVILIGNMANKFSGLIHFIGGNCDRWDTSLVTNMTKMFSHNYSLNQHLNFDIRNVISISSMFERADNLNPHNIMFYTDKDIDIDI